MSALLSAGLALWSWHSWVNTCHSCSSSALDILWYPVLHKTTKHQQHCWTPSTEFSVAWTLERPYVRASITEPELITWMELVSPSPAKEWIYFKRPQAPPGSNPSTWDLTSRKPQSSGWGQGNCVFSMFIQYLGASLQKLFRLFCSKDFRNILHNFKINN